MYNNYRILLNDMIIYHISPIIYTTILVERYFMFACILHVYTTMKFEPDYAEEFKERVEKARKLAEDARKNGGDPTDYVEIPSAEDMAERCEVLLEREYGDKIHGLAKQIREIEDDDEVSGREAMSLVLAEEFAQGELSKDFDNDAERVEAAIRTSIAILTEGVVAAPIEGIGKVEIEDNDDGSKFIRVPYFGPIRSAGGTAQAVSVLVADYVRELLDIAEFQPRDDEVERYTEEIHLYNNAVGMQYCPPKEKCRYIIRHAPIMIDGIPNSNAVKREVDGYRDLERIDGNHPRDGMCLVVAEGIGLKAPKLQRYSEAFELESWGWLDKFIDGSGSDDDDEEESEDGEQELNTTVPERKDEISILEPKTKYLGDVIAGRPIIADPSEPGAFRLRYGRSRTAGHAAVGFSPATMHIVDDFIAPSTQIKTERPGKAAGAVPVDSLEGPTVRLDTGELRRIDDIDEAKELQNNVDKILDLGEIGVPFGEFVENNHPLAPASYVQEWWELDYNDAGGDVQSFEYDSVTIQEAIELSEEYNIPLHPEYTYLWHDIEPKEYSALRGALNKATIEDGTVELSRAIHVILEKLLVPHQLNEDNVEMTEEMYELMEHCVADNPEDDDVLGQVNKSAPFTVRARAVTRIGGRMGRPEKAERREMKPYIHSLFPIGELGGMQREVAKAAQNTEGADRGMDDNYNKKSDDEYTGKGTIEADMTHRVCPECDETTWRMKCPHDNTKTVVKPICSACEYIDEDKEIGDECPRCGKGVYKETNTRILDINEAFNTALDNVQERTSSVGKIKASKKLPSDSKIPEPLEKGILRAKYDISVFRDGTARYDMCDLPLTAFKPSEVGITAEKAKELGYKETVEGEPITSGDDVIELKIQDVVVNEKAGDDLLDVANYVDDLLVQYYDCEPYYNADEPEDLIGSLMLGMAPHTSAAVVGRLLGFTRASANYAHPFFHAAKRRNCFHPDMELNVKINGKWKEYQIGDLVEEYLTEDADDSYDDGTIVQNIEEHPDIDEIKVPSMTDEGHKTLEDVTHLSKHVSTEHMVTIETDDGDDLTVTPDHKMAIKSHTDGELMTEKKAHQIEEGDELFDYGEDKINSVKDFKDIDILEYLLTENHSLSLDKVMIRGIEKEDIYKIFVDALKDDWDGRFYKLKSTAEYLDMNKKTLRNYLYRNSIPISILQELYSDEQEMINNTPKDVTLGMNSDKVQIPRVITLDEEMACFIGYYTAEGYTRQQKDMRVDGAHNGSNHTDFAASEKETRTFIKNVLDKRFNKTELYTNESRITISGNLMRFLFKDILDCGSKAHTKKIPDKIKTSRPNILGAYLGGYISGDGAMSDGLNVSMCTVSEHLIDDLIWAFDKLNVDVTLSEKGPELLKNRFPEYYDGDYESLSKTLYSINLNKENSKKFVYENGIYLNRKEKIDRVYDLDVVKDVSYVKSNVEYTYNLTVDETHKLEVEGLYCLNCDGDEDSVMLLMDAFLNFSRDYLPSQRGKNMMDAPIVMSSVIDPEEIDDEAHNVDVVDHYPKKFYEATMHAADPDDIDIELAEDRLDNPTGFKSTLPTSQIDAGPKLTAYKTLGGMQEKLDAQLALAEASRCVDERRVASLVVEKHFFPDIIGNLTAFSRQQFICGACGMKHRRAPSSGRCLRDDCPGGVRLTVYEGMVTKYVDMATELAESYSLRPYTQQRLSMLSKRIDALFLDDKEEQVTLDDYF